MTPLALSALDFARECLGWENAELAQVAAHIVTGGPSHFLQFASLDAVLEAVRVWCLQHGQDFSLNHYKYLAPVYDAEVYHSSTADLTGRGKSASPCHALLAACVEANRRLAGQLT